MATTNPEDLYGGIQNAYRTYLGRDANQDELAFHARTSPDNYDAVIKNSSEAQQWATRGTQPTTQVAGTAAAGAPGYDYNKFQDAWWHAAPGTSLDQFIKDNPTFTQGATTSNNGEWLNLPGGESFDAVRDKGGANAPMWGSYNYDYGTGKALSQTEADAQEQKWAQDHGVAFTPGGGSASGSVGGGSSSLSASSTLSPQDAALRAQLIAQLSQRAGQSLAVDPNDPNIRQQVDPYAAQQDRSARNFVADLAEKSGPYANITGQARVAAEHAGQNTGLFQAQLIGREYDARRTEIQNALTSMQGLLTTDQEMALRQELAQLDDATKRLGLQYQNSQASNRLGLDYSAFDWTRDPANPNNIPNFNGN